MRRLLFSFAVILVCGSSRAGMISITPAIWIAAPSTTVTDFLSLNTGTAQLSATESDVEGVLGGDAAWTHDTLFVRIGVAPAGAASFTFTVRKNEVDQTETCAITGAATTCTDTTHTVSFSPGDRIDLKCVPSGGPAAQGVQNSICSRWTANTTNKSPWFTSTSTAQNTVAGTNFLQAQTAGVITTEQGEVIPAPTNGTVDYLYADATTDPGAGKTIVITFRDNATDESLTCTITGNGATGKTCNDTNAGHAFAVTAGDQVDWKLVETAGGTTTKVRVGCNFKPTIDGECTTSQGASLVQNATQYSFSGTAYDATEANRQVGFYPCVIKKFYILVTTNAFAVSPNGQGATTVIRQNTASSSVTATVTSDGVSKIDGNDTAHSFTVNQGDLISLQTTTTATSGTSTVRYGFVMYIAPTVANTGDPSGTLIRGVGSLISDPGSIAAAPFMSDRRRG